MQVWGTGAKTLLSATIIAVGCQFATTDARATTLQQGQLPAAPVHHLVAAWSSRMAHGKGAIRYHAYAGGGLSCVPFARSDSGIDVAGNAWQWWSNAAGVYARGSVPEPGSVLAFRANGRMRLGHVAVVSRVINAREVEIDHANWSGGGMRGSVARGVPVVDVSEANDWSAVRVALGRSPEFGAVYPTYGFIYDRPDTGVVEASAAAPAPKPELNPVPTDLRPRAERGWETYEQVAEAPPVAVAQKHHRRETPMVSATYLHQVSAVAPAQ